MKIFSKEKYVHWCYNEGDCPECANFGWAIEADGKEVVDDKIHSEDCYPYSVADVWCVDTLMEMVEVIRCRNCKWRGTGYCPMRIPNVPDDVEFLERFDDDFCSYAEPKEE